MKFVSGTVTVFVSGPGAKLVTLELKNGVAAALLVKGVVVPLSDCSTGRERLSSLRRTKIA